MNLTTLAEATGGIVVVAAKRAPKPIKHGRTPSKSAKPGHKHVPVSATNARIDKLLTDAGYKQVSPGYFEREFGPRGNEASVLIDYSTTAQVVTVTFMYESADKLFKLHNSGHISFRSFTAKTLNEIEKYAFAVTSVKIPKAPNYLSNY